MIIHLPDHILYEDDVIIVLTKPAGLMVEPDRNGHPNLLQQVKKYLQKKYTGKGEVYAQHIHRLDRPVAGIVLFAKDKTVLKNLSEQFAERKVKKFYRAITATAPVQRAGTLEQWHRKEKKKAQLYKEEVAYAEIAKLSYEVAESGTHRFAWTIELHTGKFHQIRAQLADAGCPILGDALYGSDQPYLSGAIALEAYKLIFTHPLTHKEMIIEVNDKIF